MFYIIKSANGLSILIKGELKMKKIIIKGIFLIFLIVCMHGCTSQKEGFVSGETSAANEIYTVNIAFGNQEDEPLGKQALKWKELAEEKSDGRLELILYPNSQLGAEKDVVEQAML